MAEGSYEYECMRAELLGLKTPDKEEFQINQATRLEALEDEMDTINLEDTQFQDEQHSRIGGKLNELNSILKNTQKKINNFKTYGFVTTAVTTLFKLKKDSDLKNAHDNPENLDNNADDRATTSNNESIGADSDDIPPKTTLETCKNGISTPSNTPVKKSDLTRALDRQTDVLDKLLDQSENAQYSMMQQKKEMKRFLK